MTNKFLTHVKNPSYSSLQQYFDEIGHIHRKDFEEIKQNSHLSVITLASGLLILIVLAVLYTVIRIYLVKRRTREFANIRHEIAYETALHLARTITNEVPAISEHNIEETD